MYEQINCMSTKIMVKAASSGQLGDKLSGTEVLVKGKILFNTFVGLLQIAILFVICFGELCKSCFSFIKEERKKRKKNPKDIWHH